MILSFCRGAAFGLSLTGFSMVVMVGRSFSVWLEFVVRCEMRCMRLIVNNSCQDVNYALAVSVGEVD